MILRITKISLIIISVFILIGCSPASYHAEQVRGENSDRISVGKVQREIKVGMSSAEVASALGAPNLITTDEHRREQWVYDKIATESVYSTSQGGIGALIFAVPNALLTGGHGGIAGSSGAKSTQQRTLTIIVKFDKTNKVRDFAYHNSSF